ncbi:MAG: HD-GYP domain-containing protein [Planctomycetota bacterium]
MTDSTPVSPDAMPPLCSDTNEALKSEVDQLTSALASRFEELSLIHGLNQRFTGTLTLGEDPTSVAQLLVEELTPCISAKTLAVEIFPDPTHPDQRGVDIFACVGERRSRAQFASIAEATRASAQQGNEHATLLQNHFTLDGERLRVAVVPIERPGINLGRMIAIRSVEDPEFGTVEADMMLSTSLMLAVHLINQRQYLQLQSVCETMIQSLASALDAKDSYTCGHSNRVAELSCQLARRLGYDEKQITNIRMGGILHDIGKIGVDDSVLRKPGRLTDEEFDQVKRHPILGFEILRSIDFFQSILPAVRHHHESWDGNGYPDGLVGSDIPRDAQIMAVADAFDAMISDRPYRSGMRLERVTEIFIQGRGQQWAADVVDALLQCQETMTLHADRAKADSLASRPLAYSMA